MYLEPGIIIKINNEIFLIVNDKQYLNLSKYYTQEDNEGESIIKDYNNDILYIFKNDCHHIPIKNLEQIPEGNFNYNLISNKIHNIKIIYDNNII